MSRDFDDETATLSDYILDVREADGTQTWTPRPPSSSSVYLKM